MVVPHRLRDLNAINGLREVLTAAADVFEPDTSATWMLSQNSYLDGIPLDVLEIDGNPTRVLEAVEHARQVAWGS